MRKQFISTVLAAFIIAAALVLWHTVSLYPDLHRRYFEISLKSPVEDGARLYFDLGHGLSEKNSRGFTLQGDNQYHRYRIDIPVDSIRLFRFDPPTTPEGSIVIDHAAIVDSAGRTIETLDLTKWKPHYQIKYSDLRDGKLTIVTDEKANDPQVFILLSQALPSLKPDYVGYLLKSSILFEFLILFVMLSLPIAWISIWYSKNKRMALILAFIFFIFGLRCWSLYQDRNTPFLELSVKAASTDIMRLYSVTTDGSIDTSKANLVLWGGGHYNTYRFELPTPRSPIRSFFFHPTTHGGIVGLRDMRIVDGFGCVLRSIPLGAIKPLEHTNRLRVESNEAIIESHPNTLDPLIGISLQTPFASDPARTFIDSLLLIRIMSEFIFLAIIIVILTFLIDKRGTATQEWLVHGRLIPIIFFTFPVLLLLPALWYSLNTPFALVDDYGMSCIIEWLHGGFSDWLKSAFAGDAGGRYRPLFELYNFLSWWIIGPRPAWHHAARWLIQLVSLFFLIRTITYWKQDNGDAKGSNKRKSIDYYLCILVTIYIFMFFPNQPAARLGPQEVNTVFFLTLANLTLARMFYERSMNAPAIGWKTLLMFMISCAGLSLSKEVNVGLLALFLFTLPFLFIGNLLSKRFLVTFGSQLLLLLFTVIRVRAAAGGSDYGKAPLSWDLFYGNAQWITHCIFETWTSRWVSLTMVCVLSVLLYNSFQSLRNKKLPKESLFTLFLYIEFLVLFATFCTSWTQAIRYWYPLVPVLALLMAFGFRCILRGSKESPWGLNGMRFAAMLFLIFFALVNYYSLLTQYAVQHNIRQVEKKMLDRVTERILAGDPFTIHYDSSTDEIELMAHSQIYFTRFLPNYFGRRLPIQTAHPKQMGSTYYTIGPNPLDKKACLEEVIAPDWDYQWLRWSSAVSGTLQGRLFPPSTELNYMRNYRWYIYKAGNC
jgi:hypothetical protein